MRRRHFDAGVFRQNVQTRKTDRIDGASIGAGLQQRPGDDVLALGGGQMDGSITMAVGNVGIGAGQQQKIYRLDDAGLDGMV